MQLVKEKDLNIGQILGIARKIYFENTKTLLFILFVLFFPVCIIRALIEFQIYDLNIDFNVLVNDRDILFQFISSDIGKRFMVYNFLQYMVIVFCEPLGIMAVAWFGYTKLLEEKTDYKLVSIRALDRIGALIWTSILYSIFVWFGSIFILPGLLAMLYFSFYIYAVVLNGERGIVALFQSANTFKKGFLKVVGCLIVIFVCNYALNYGVIQIFYWGLDYYAFNVLASMISYFVNMFFYISFKVLFLNRKFLKELSVNVSA